MDIVDEIRARRAESEQALADYEAAIARYREAVWQGKRELGATELAKRLGISRVRVYQLLPDDD